MKQLYKLALASFLTASLVACGSSDSEDETNEVQPEAEVMAKFSLGLSDTPVDDAVAVYIEVDSIKLTEADGSDTPQETVINNFTNEDNEDVESIKVNLLDYQGSSQLKIVDEASNIELEAGTYDMEVTVIDAGSYVLLEDDATEHAIKVPSSRLRLGEFEVSTDAEQVNDTPAYTIEFDLRKSLVRRGNANNNKGFIIKPHGVRIVSLAGDIAGTVSADLLNLGQCVVYLYDEAVTEYGDMFDPEDEEFVAPDGEITASAPLATTVVGLDGNFSIGFVSVGSYQLALTCGTQEDDNIQFDGLTIPDAASITPEVKEISVNSGQTTNVSFD